MIKSIESVSDDYLINRYLNLYALIYIEECFGSNDMREIEELAKELFKRDYEVVEQLPIIRKKF
mgnify:CR=1 FL=1